MNKEDLKPGNVIVVEENDENPSQKFLFQKGFDENYFISLDELNHECYKYSELYFSFGDCCSDCCRHIIRVYEDYTCSKLLWKDENQPELTDKDKEFLEYLPEKVKAEVNAFIKFIDWYLKVNFLDNPQISYTELGVAYKIYKDIVYKAECSFGKIMKKENN